jgi:hypothetical protein
MSTTDVSRDEEEEEEEENSSHAAFYDSIANHLSWWTLEKQEKRKGQP